MQRHKSKTAFWERMTESVETFQANKAKVEAGTHTWHGGDVWKVPGHKRPLCGARTRAGGVCQAQAMPGGTRCRMHGGHGISGPKTEAGRQAIADANRRRRKLPERVPQASSPSLPSVVETPVPALTDAQKRAAVLLGLDSENDAEIAAQCGVSRRTLARWKHLPPFEALYQRAWTLACEHRAIEQARR